MWIWSASPSHPMKVWPALRTGSYHLRIGLRAKLNPDRIKTHPGREKEPEQAGRFVSRATWLPGGRSGNGLERLVVNLQRDDERHTFKLQAKLQRGSIGDRVQVVVIPGDYGRY